MVPMVSNSKDFKTILTECTYGFDTSKDTADARVMEWLWLSRDNRVIGKDAEDVYTDPLDVSEGIDSIIRQISEFTNKLDKLCMIYYLVSSTDMGTEYLRLSTSTGEPSVDNDNMEVNDFLEGVSVMWINYSVSAYNEQIKLLSALLGKDVIDSLQKSAPMALKNEQIGPLEKQLRARGFTDDPNWKQLYEKIKLVKRDYREKLRGKNLAVFSNSGLEKYISYDAYLSKVAELKDAIKHNIEMLGGVSDAEIL